jgi:hypothetical protein
MWGARADSPPASSPPPHIALPFVLTRCPDPCGGSSGPPPPFPPPHPCATPPHTIPHTPPATPPPIHTPRPHAPTPGQLLGQNLAEARHAVPGGRLPPAAAAAVGLSTLAALREVHAAGLIHRDVKPANFVVDPPGAAADAGACERVVGWGGRAGADASHAPPCARVRAPWQQPCLKRANALARATAGARKGRSWRRGRPAKRGQGAPAYGARRRP